jgi:hypothetical protein
MGFATAAKPACACSGLTGPSFPKVRRRNEMRRYLYLLVGLVMPLVLLAGCGSEKPKQQGPTTLQASSDEYTASLEISPAIVGPNTFKATIADQQKKALTSGQAVLRFAMAGMDHGKSELTLTANADGQWLGEGPHLMMPGEWQLQLVWTDEAGKTHAFDYVLTLSE